MSERCPHCNQQHCNCRCLATGNGVSEAAEPALDAVTVLPDFWGDVLVVTMPELQVLTAF